MKNREWRRHGRKIKEVKPGVWRCRLDIPTGVAVIPDITVDSRDMAWKWLDGEIDLKFPDPGLSRREKQLIQSRAVNHPLVLRRKALERILLHPNAFVNYAKQHYRRQELSEKP
jgi:hypothetical protein